MPLTSHGHIPVLRTLTQQLLETSQQSQIPGALRELTYFASARFRESPNSLLAICTSALPLLVSLGTAIDTLVRSITYADRHEPSLIHNAIAKLAQPVEVAGHLRPGLATIVSFAVDDHIDTAVDQHNVPRKSFNDFAGLRTEHAGAVESSDRDCAAVKIYHCNLFLPKSPQDTVIDSMVFRMFSRICLPHVDAQSMAFKSSKGEPQNCPGELKASELVHELQTPSYFIAEASRAATGRHGSHVLLIGVQTDDPDGRGLIQQWHGPTRCQYFTFVRWPSQCFNCLYVEATTDQIRAASRSFRVRQCQPIWFDHVHEIPTFLESIIGP